MTENSSMMQNLSKNINWKGVDGFYNKKCDIYVLETLMPDESTFFFYTSANITSSTM